MTDQAEVIRLLQQQIEYLTGVPEASGVINDYRDPNVDAAILRCRECGDAETAHVLACLRLIYRSRQNEVTTLRARLAEISSLASITE